MNIETLENIILETLTKYDLDTVELKEQYDCWPDFEEWSVELEEGVLLDIYVQADEVDQELHPPGDIFFDDFDESWHLKNPVEGLRRIDLRFLFKGNHSGDISVTVDLEKDTLLRRITKKLLETRCVDGGVGNCQCGIKLK